MTSRIDPMDVRVGFKERNETADRLAQAHALGQLDLDEFEERVAQAQEARTRRDLESLCRDLPSTASGVGKVAARAEEGFSRVREHPRRWIAFALAALMSFMVMGWIFGEHEHVAPASDTAGAYDHAWHGPSPFGILLMVLIGVLVAKTIRRRRSAHVS